MTNVQAFASQSFSSYASRNIRVDQDRNGLFCKVADRSGEWMTVRCMESKTSVYASHCNCSTFAKHQHCSHVDTVQAYWNRLYKVEAPKVVEAPKKVRKPRNGLVRKVRGGGLVRVEQKVTPVVEVIEQPATVAPKVAILFTEKARTPRKFVTEMIEAQENKAAIVAQMTDISTRGNLNGQRGFSLMR